MSKASWNIVHNWSLSTLPERKLHYYEFNKMIQASFNSMISGFGSHFSITLYLNSLSLELSQDFTTFIHNLALNTI